MKTYVVWKLANTMEKNQAGKWVGIVESVAISMRVNRGGFTENVAFKQSPRREEGVSHVCTWRKSTLGEVLDAEFAWHVQSNEGAQWGWGEPGRDESCSRRLGAGRRASQSAAWLHLLQRRRDATRTSEWHYLTSILRSLWQQCWKWIQGISGRIRKTSG